MTITYHVWSRPTAATDSCGGGSGRCAGGRTTKYASSGRPARSPAVRPYLGPARPGTARRGPAAAGVGQVPVRPTDRPSPDAADHILMTRLPGPDRTRRPQAGPLGPNQSGRTPGPATVDSSAAAAAAGAGARYGRPASGAMPPSRCSHKQRRRRPNSSLGRLRGRVRSCLSGQSSVPGPHTDQPDRTGPPGQRSATPCRP